MKTIVVPEYGRIPYSAFTRVQRERLRRLDGQHRDSSGSGVFDWMDRRYIKARNYVGVVQVPGVTIEILPKIDRLFSPHPLEAGHLDEVHRKAQANLLFMLSYTRHLPIRQRNFATLQEQKMPLLESLLALFMEHTVGQLHKGIPRAYMHREGNRRFLKGKLVLHRHIRHNATHPERVYVRNHEFLADTPMNRILKAACAAVTALSKQLSTQRRALEALALLESVQDCTIGATDFDRLSWDRHSERFLPLIDLAHMVLMGTAPSPQRGATRAFSMLFPMDTLFEEFVAGFILRHCRELGLKRDQVHVQAKARAKWLVYDQTHRGRFRLKPDILIDCSDRNTPLVIDTKWKQLKINASGQPLAIDQSDMYQMYAYAKRYQARKCVLLYPHMDGLQPATYSIDGEPASAVHIGYVDLNRRLPQERAALIDEMNNLLVG